MSELSVLRQHQFGSSPGLMGFYQYSTLKWIAHFSLSAEHRLSLLPKQREFGELPQALTWLSCVKNTKSMDESTSGNEIILQSHLNKWVDDTGAGSQSGWLDDYLVGLLRLRNAANSLHGSISLEHAEAMHETAWFYALCKSHPRAPRPERQC